MGHLRGQRGGCPYRVLQLEAGLRRVGPSGEGEPMENAGHTLLPNLPGHLAVTE